MKKYTFAPLSFEMEQSLRDCHLYEEIGELGFEICRKLKNYKNYENFRKDIFVCYKIDEKSKTYSVATFFDESDGEEYDYCSYASKDLYIGELDEKINNEVEITFPKISDLKKNNKE